MDGHSDECHAIAEYLFLVRLQVVLVQRLDGDWPMILSILRAMASDDGLPHAA